MFTGIVETIGTIGAITPDDGVTRFEISCDIAPELAPGASVAVNGVCLSAVRVGESAFDVEAIPETLARTSLGRLSRGQTVNLERPMPADGRFDGHMVQGHVDGVAKVRSITPEGGSRRIWFDLPLPLMRYVVAKGSITVDGVSLTVSGVDDDGFEVSLIPITLSETTLGALRLADIVNIEVDIVAKYVERMVRDR